MSTVNRFEDLEVWQNAREICKTIKEITQRKMFVRDFALIDQITRSTGSIMDYIAEGFERDGTKEFIQFLSISKGSVGEVRSQLHRAYDFNYIQKDQLDQLIIKLSSLSTKIQNLIQYLKTTNFKGHKYK